jgi:hypothetical protein
MLVTGREEIELCIALSDEMSRSTAKAGKEKIGSAGRVFNELTDSCKVEDVDVFPFRLASAVFRKERVASPLRRAFRSRMSL